MSVTYTTQDEVRDYECDAQGIVNNAEYMHYCEHARNKYIISLGYTLEKLHVLSQDPVVTHAVLEFKKPLYGGDVYQVHTRITTKGAMRLIFHQTIVTAHEEVERIHLQAVFTVAVLSAGKPMPLKNTIFAPAFIV